MNERLNIENLSQEFYHDSEQNKITSNGLYAKNTSQEVK